MAPKMQRKRNQSPPRDPHGMFAGMFVFFVENAVSRLRLQVIFPFVYIHIYIYIFVELGSANNQLIIIKPNYF